MTLFYTVGAIGSERSDAKCVDTQGRPVCPKCNPEAYAKHEAKHK